MFGPGAVTAVAKALADCVAPPPDGTLPSQAEDLVIIFWRLSSPPRHE